MKRWSTTEKRMIEDPMVDAFLGEILDVCKRHGFSLSHEDQHGAFIVVPYHEDTNVWVATAGYDRNPR